MLACLSLVPGQGSSANYRFSLEEKSPGALQLSVTRARWPHLVGPLLLGPWLVVVASGDIKLAAWPPSRSRTVLLARLQRQLPSRCEALKKEGK